MIVRVTWPGEAHTRYSQEAFDAQIGKLVKLNVGPKSGGVIAPSILKSATTHADGGVEFEFEVTDPVACVLLSAYVATGAVDNITIEEEDLKDS